MGMMHDHFLAEAEGRRVEVVARQTLWGSAEYSLLVDGGLADTLYLSTWGVFLTILGVRKCVLWAERRAGRWRGAEGRSGAARSEAIKGVGGVALGASSPRRAADEAPSAADVAVWARIMQGWMSTWVALEVNGVPVPMHRLV